MSESGLLSVSHLSRAALFLVCGVGLLLPVSLAVAGYTRKALAGTPGDAVLVAAAFVLVSLTALRWPRRLGDKAFLVMSAVLFLIAKLAFVHVVVKAPEGDLANYWRLATVVAEGGLEALEHEDDYNLMLVPRIFPYFLPLVHFFGPEASSFRIANVLATILSAGLAYTFASDHFGKRPARLTFALSLLAFDPWLTSTVSSHDIPGTLYTLAALLAYSKIPRALGAARRRAALLYSIAFGVLTYLANLQRNVGIFLLLACFLVAILSMLGELRGKWPHLGRGVLFFILLPAVLIKGLALAYDATDLPAHERGDDIYLLTMGFSDSWHDGTFLFYEASYLMKGFTTMPEAQSPRFPLHKLLSDIYYNPGERLWSYLRKAKSFYTFERSDHYYLSDARLRGQGAMTDRQKKRLVVVRAFFIVPFFLLFLLGSVAVWERRRLSLFAFLPLVYMAFLSGPLIVLSEIQPRYLYPLWFIAAIYIGALFMERGRPAAARPDGGLDILHVYKDYPPVLGGIELHLRLLAEAQARRGHRVTVLVTARGWRTERAEENGVRVIRAGRLATWASTPLSLALVLELRRRMPDVTHLHAPHPPGEVAQLLFGRSRATVMTWHSDVVRQRRLGRLYRPLQRRVLDRIDLVLPTSTRYRESSPVLSRLPAERCRAVPLGVDAERFARPDPERVEALRRRPRYAAGALRRPLALLQGGRRVDPGDGGARDGHAARRWAGGRWRNGGGHSPRCRPRRSGSASWATWTTASCRPSTPPPTSSSCRRPSAARPTAWRSSRRWRRARRWSRPSSAPGRASSTAMARPASWCRPETPTPWRRRSLACSATMWDAGRWVNVPGRGRSASSPPSACFNRSMRSTETCSNAVERRFPCGFGERAELFFS